MPEDRFINLDNEAPDPLDAIADANNAAEQESAATRERSEWERRLQPNGEPLPRMITQNKRDMVYISPRAQYVQSPKQLELNDVAKDWRVPTQTIMRWSREQNWLNQRVAWQQEANDYLWVTSAQNLAQRRLEALNRGIRNLRLIGEVAVSMLEQGTKEIMSPLGQAESVALDTSDIYRLGKTIETSTRGELACVGLNLRVQKEIEEDDPNAQAPASGTLYVFPATEEEREKYGSTEVAMKIPELEGRIIEGVVVPDNEAEKVKKP